MWENECPGTEDRSEDLSEELSVDGVGPQGGKRKWGKPVKGRERVLGGGTGPRSRGTGDRSSFPLPVLPDPAGSSDKSLRPWHSSSLLPVSVLCGLHPIDVPSSLPFRYRLRGNTSGWGDFRCPTGLGVAECPDPRARMVLRVIGVKDLGSLQSADMSVTVGPRRSTVSCSPTAQSLDGVGTSTIPRVSYGPGSTWDRTLLDWK